MESFSLGEAALWVRGALAGDASLRIGSVSTDSRDIGQDCLFIPLAGERFDGHDFIEKAIGNGAKAILTHRDGAWPVPSVRVGDTRQALLDLAGGYRAERAAKVVGVTGSVGKTTTKEMVASVLAQRFDTVKTQGNLNNEIGLPQSVLHIGARTQAAVLEMGMNHAGELARMTRAARPDFAVITNIGTSHIEYLGSREGILKAKLEILEGLSAGGAAVLCGDEPLLWDKRGVLPCRTVYYGIENPECDLTAEEIVNEGEVVRFEVRNRRLWECRQIPVGETIRAHLSVAGRHNVLNALAAVAIALQLGEEPGDIVAGLAAYQPEGLRQNTYEKNGYLIFADCYNASPDAVEAALQAFSELMCTGRRFAVLGGMLELGDYAAEGHRRAGRAAAKYADCLYLYGAGCAHTREGALEGGMAPQNIHFFDTHEALAEALRAEARPGDALLFKGSRGMKMERALQLFTGEV